MPPSRRAMRRRPARQWLAMSRAASAARGRPAALAALAAAAARAQGWVVAVAAGAAADPVPVDAVPVADAAGAGDGVLDESAELSVAFRVAAAPVGPDAPDPGLPAHASPAMRPAPARIAATVIPTVQCRALRRSRAKCCRPRGGSQDPDRSRGHRSPRARRPASSWARTARWAGGLAGRPPGAGTCCPCSEPAGLAWDIGWRSLGYP